MQSILVTGSGGQVGQELRSIAAKYSQYNFVFCTREDLDITDEKLINNFLKLYDFKYCINCAAYTAVDKAEEEADAAMLINGDAAGFLAKACRYHHVQLVHISTDFVFDGKKSSPYTEEDQPHPNSMYGQSKFEGEKNILELNPHALIIRTSWVYSTFGNNFMKTMLRLGAERDELRVVYDQVGTPTYAADLAEAIMQIISRHELRDKGGVYHYSNEGVTSWFDFAKAIMEMGEMDCNVSPITTAEYPTPAKRPPYSVLEKSKIKKVFGIEIPYWRESLRNALSGI